MSNLSFKNFLIVNESEGASSIINSCQFDLMSDEKDSFLQFKLNTQ